MALLAHRAHRKRPSAPVAVPFPKRTDTPAERPLPFLNPPMEALKPIPVDLVGLSDIPRHRGVGRAAVVGEKAETSEQELVDLDLRAK